MKKNKYSDKSVGFPDLVFALGRRLREEFKKNIENSGSDGRCTIIDFAVLNYVNESVTPFMKDISDNLFISKPATSEIVNSMVLRKFLRRVTDSIDRRAIRIELTSSGKQYLLDQKKKKIAVLKKAFLILSDSERKQLVSLLEKVAFSEIKKSKK